MFISSLYKYNTFFGIYQIYGHRILTRASSCIFLRNSRRRDEARIPLDSSIQEPYDNHPCPIRQHGHSLGIHTRQEQGKFRRICQIPRATSFLRNTPQPDEGGRAHGRGYEMLAGKELEPKTDRGRRRPPPIIPKESPCRGSQGTLVSISCLWSLHNKKSGATFTSGSRKTLKLITTYRFKN